MSGAARGRDGWAAIALVLAVAALRPQLVLGAPWRFGADALEYAIPHAALLLRELAEGRFPLWNPFHDGGAPFLAQPPWMGPVYPGAALFALGPGRALDLGFLLHGCSFVVGAYALARARGLGRLPSWLAAFALGAGAPLSELARLGYLPEAVAASYLPWILLCLDRGLRGAISAGETVIGAGVCLGLMHLGGHLVASGAVLFGVGFYGLALGASRGGGRGAARALGMLITSEALGATLAAVQLAPLLASGLASSLRGGREISAEYAYLGEPWRLGQFLFARFDPSGKGHVFLGVALLPFVALAGRVRSGARRTDTELWAMAAGSLVLSLGDATPLWRMLRAALPPLTIFSYFYFFLIPAALAVALLAAHGLDGWLTEGHGDRAAGTRGLRIAVALFAALALATAAWLPADRYAEGVRLAELVRASLPWTLAALAAVALVSVWRRAAAPVIALAVVAELAYFAAPAALERGAGFDAEKYFDRARLADALPPPGAGRVLGVERTRRARDWVLRRNGGLAVGYEDVGIDSKLPLARVAALAARLESVELDWVTRLAASKGAGAAAPALTLAPESTDVRVLDVLGVTTLVADVPVEGGAYRRPLRDTTGDDAEDARVAVWERSPRPPRAFVAASWRNARSPSEALVRLLDEPASPLESPVLESVEVPSPTGGGDPRAACQPVKRVWAPGAVDLDTACDAPALLVTGEIAARGWRVTVDGARARAAVANTVTLAVPLTAGDHHVEIRYVPGETVGGAMVSAASWAGLAFAVLAGRPRRTRLRS